MHIPKVAGTSIEWHLLKALGYNHYSVHGLLVDRNLFPWKGPPSKGHLKARDYVSKGWLTQAEWDQALKFTVVRNPYAKLVSAYNGRSASWRYRKIKGAHWSFREFVLEWFPKWYDDNYIGSHDNYHHVIPQTDYILDKNGQQMVDKIFKLENLKNEFPSFLQSLGLNEAMPPHENVSKQRDPQTGMFLENGVAKLSLTDYYDEDTIAFVKEYYKKDFEFLNYSSVL